MLLTKITYKEEIMKNVCCKSAHNKNLIKHVEEWREPLPVSPTVG